MSMSKQDFDRAARTVNRMTFLSPYDRYNVALSFAINVCEAANPRFDIDRWLSACGFDVAEWANDSEFEWIDERSVWQNPDLMEMSESDMTRMMLDAMHLAWEVR